MKTLRPSLVIVLAAAIPAALVAQAIGSPLFRETAVEAILAAFASAAVLIIALADYAYRRPRDIVASAVTARIETSRPARTPAACSHLPPVASLTGCG